MASIRDFLWRVRSYRWSMQDWWADRPRMQWRKPKRRASTSPEMLAMEAITNRVVAHYIPKLAEELARGLVDPMAGAKIGSTLRIKLPNEYRVKDE